LTQPGPAGREPLTPAGDASRETAMSPRCAARAVRRLWWSRAP